MKTTLTQLKKKVIDHTNTMGAPLSKKNPHWINAAYIDNMKQVVDFMKVMGKTYPDKRPEIDANQLKQLNSWIDELKIEYLASKK